MTQLNSTILLCAHAQEGKDLYSVLEDVFKRHEVKIAGTELSASRTNGSIKTMKMFELFWTSQTQFSGLASLDDEE